MNKLDLQLNKRTVLILLLLFFLGIGLGMLIFGRGTPLKKQYKLPDFPTTTEAPPPLQQPPLPQKTPEQTLVVGVNNAPLHAAASSQSGVLERLSAQTVVQVLDTKVLAVATRDYAPTEAVMNRDKMVIIRGKVYQLKRGQTVEILSFDGNSYRAQVKFDKAGWVEMPLSPKEITLRKTYDWYQVRTPSGNVGWLYGSFVQ